MYIKYCYYRYVLLRQGGTRAEEAVVFVGGKEGRLSSSMYEAIPICDQVTSTPTSGEICDCYEEVDTAEQFVVQGGTKRAGEDREGLEPSAVEHEGPLRKRSTKKPFEPVRIGQSKVELIESLLDTYIYSPPNVITHSLYWANHPDAKFIPASSPEFQLAIFNHQTKLANMTFDEFLSYYRKQRFYIFRPGVSYHTVEDSLKFAESWLEKQSVQGTWMKPSTFGYEQHNISIKQWLQLISNVVNRRERKRFALILQGPTSCGKTWFTNMILDFYLNKGELNNWNRYENCSFPFMGLVNRRIALWNEACLNGDALQKEHLKVLFEGESKTVSVKNQKDGTIIATPIIVTTNNQTLERAAEFRERQYVFNVARVDLFTGGPNCPGFKSLHPFAWPQLLKKYSIDVDECASVNKVCEVMSLENFMQFDEICIES
nr:MAG: nonstructural protein NS1 [Bee densovirus 8]